MYVRTAPCQLAVQEADGGGLKDTNGYKRGEFSGCGLLRVALELRVAV